MTEEEWAQFIEEYRARRQFERRTAGIARWLVPGSWDGWVAMALFFAIMVPLTWVGLNFWLAMVCGWGGQFVFYVILRLWHKV